MATRSTVDDMGERLLRAAEDLLRDEGPAELTVRRIAQAAGTSTMGVYSRFGSRAGVLEALYLRGFEELSGRFAETPGQGITLVRGLTAAYREFALDAPSRYALMFDRPLPDFDPDPQLRSTALAATFTPLVDAVAAAADQGSLIAPDPQRTAYQVWCLAHGVIGLELTHSVRSPLPGWFLDSREVGAAVLAEAIDALLRGLAAPS